ncbi:MAG: glycosyltransferase family 39 protein [Planctomycetes bacterium]|nr:glycosyltransferase family 39 protein [Planctomycetota bacterium]
MRSFLRRRPWLLALVLAVAMTLANLWEPLTVDDVCHHYYAAQVAAAPADPYGFVVPWHQQPRPAWQVMVPPVHSYWWAAALRLFGDSPPLWHLWFLPIYWLLCASVLDLLRRWARPHAAAVTAAIGLGPALLPGANFMLDVPMLAFALASLACLQRAVDRRSVPLGLAAGVLLGLALQTKYSALAYFGPWFLLALWRRRPRELLAGLAGVVATAGGIEWLLALAHGGGSYFLQHLGNAPARDWDHVLRGLLMQYGVLGMPAALLALWGLGVRGWRFAAAGLVYAAGYLLVAWSPLRSNGAPGLVHGAGYAAMVALTWGATLWLLWVAARRGLRRRRPAALAGVFFAAWFVAELAASLLMSPFPAARRVLGMTVVATVAAAWWSARQRGSQAPVRLMALVTVGLGLGYQLLDCIEGTAWTAAAPATAAWARQYAPAAALFFTGGWGFEYYAPRAGMRPLLTAGTVLRAGDLVAAGSLDGTELPWFEASELLEPVAELTFGDDVVPLSLHHGYYSGRRPIDHQHGPRYVVRLLRARRDFTSADLVPLPLPLRFR